MVTPSKQSVVDYANKVMQTWSKDKELEYTKLTQIMDIDQSPFKVHNLKNGVMLTSFKQDSPISWVYVPNEVQITTNNVSINSLPFVLDEKHIEQVLGFDKLFD